MICGVLQAKWYLINLITTENLHDISVLDNLNGHWFFCVDDYGFSNYIQKNKFKSQVENAVISSSVYTITTDSLIVQDNMRIKIEHRFLYIGTVRNAFVEYDSIFETTFAEINSKKEINFVYHYLNVFQNSIRNKSGIETNQRLTLKGVQKLRPTGQMVWQYFSKQYTIDLSDIPNWTYSHVIDTMKFSQSAEVKITKKCRPLATLYK